MAKVLVVDDSAFMRMRNVNLLKELGHETLEAGDGNEAVEVYKRDNPDAVLMDITMPGMDGMEALRQILAHDPAAKVAMVTAMGQQGIVMDAIKAGASDFVVKPFDPDRVKAALAKLGA
ncbi:MAG: response regulator [Chloroflexi bacterium]|nr:response regulator [Chloroflexota bacterium]